MYHPIETELDELNGNASSLASGVSVRGLPTIYALHSMLAADANGDFITNGGLGSCMRRLGSIDGVYTCKGALSLVGGFCAGY